jgi:hypothetical protein
VSSPSNNLFVRSTSWPQTIKRVWVRRKIHQSIRDGRWNQPYIGSHALPLELNEPPFTPALLASLYDFETRAIVDRYLATGASAALSPRGVPDWVNAAKANVSDAQIEARFAATKVVAESLPDPSFTIIIPFFRHLRFLRSCLRSVARAIAHAPCEVIVINDDPSISRGRIELEIPTSIRSKARIVQPPQNLGITGALNVGIQASSGQWVLFLDCDDEIEAEAISVLSKYIRLHPQVRYISSCMIDIDDEGRLLRYRRRTSPPSSLITHGMNVGHLKAIRRDAFQHYGLLEPAFNGCQDYEFAMRLALFEPILSIPEYLYRYRWHHQTQSVSSAARQDRTTASILDFIRTVIWASRQRVPAVWRQNIQTFFGIQQVNLDALVP